MESEIFILDFSLGAIVIKDTARLELRGSFVNCFFSDTGVKYLCLMAHVIMYVFLRWSFVVVAFYLAEDVFSR